MDLRSSVFAAVPALQGGPILFKGWEHIKRLGAYCYHPFPQICQLEHFNKAHKKHCKYFLGSKVKEESLHNPHTCSKCIQMRAVGKRNMTLQEGSFVCIFDYQAFLTGVLQLLKNKTVVF
jgi:hypothetical protein